MRFSQSPVFFPPLPNMLMKGLNLMPELRGVVQLPFPSACCLSGLLLEFCQYGGVRRSYINPENVSPFFIFELDNFALPLHIHTCCIHSHIGGIQINKRRDSRSLSLALFWIVCESWGHFKDRCFHCNRHLLLRK